MAIGRKAPSKKIAKVRNTKALATKAGNSAKNQSVKGNDLTIHQRKNTSRKAYQVKTRGQADLKEK